MGDYLNGTIAIESINGGYGLDFDFMDWIYFLSEAWSNGWNPVGIDPDNEMVFELQGNFPVITDQDAFSLLAALQISRDALVEKLFRETNETNFSSALKKDFGTACRFYQFTDLIELLGYGECYLRVGPD